jgi:dTDP-4-dehydrorhamnose 3,5-epimerase
MGQINVIETSLPGVLIIEPKVFGDQRGWFYEAYSKRDYAAAGIGYDFVQDNRSFSQTRGTLRGIHFQRGGAAQAKLVWCGSGMVVDVAVDLRQGSPTYLKWEAVVLSDENRRQFMIPRGFGHAFLTLSDDVEFCYKADNFYNYDADGGVRFDDPDIGVDWTQWGFARSADGFYEEIILSDKDRSAPFAKDADTGFTYSV